MTVVPSLKVLADNRDALLLAEVAAWLHDMGKCADEHIINQASDRPQNYSYRYKTAQTHRLPATLNDINLLGETVSVKDLIEQGMPRVISNQSCPWLLRALGKCHAVSHVEKELDDRDTATKQPKDDTRLSTAFGVEGSAVTGLTALLDALPFGNLTDRASFVPKVEAAFDHALGDTRRPVNEVTLADWSGTVAAFYKSALAGALLGVKPDPDALHWRLLRVNFDVLGLYAKAVQIADLLGYQRAVEEACQRIKQWVEEDYPLGNEVYRDTTGIYFTFPDLDLPADLAQEIRRCVEEVEPELAPRIAVTVGDGQTATEQLRGILAKARKEAVQALAQPFDGQNLSTCWQQQWETVGEGKWELCPICRLRPMQEGREACRHCLKRHGSRIAAWQQDPRRTIWMDELADANGRVALIVGKFGLDDWLSGDLVQTLLVRAAQNDPAHCVPKNPSPARLRRIWETCQRFWTETVQGILDALPRRVRWLLEVQDKSNLPPEGVVCDGTLNGQPISVWRVDNALLTVSFVPRKPEPGPLILSWERDGRKGRGEYQVQGVQTPPDSHLDYYPTLTLLASPDQFLALVPATDALEIADKIREEYARQFSKVQNRLPLFLGVVFFPRKMPLMAVMDTARRMLEAPLEEEQWKIAQDVTGGQVIFANGERWTVPVLMGDGQTPDEWYPYWFVTQADPEQHQRRFQLRGEGDTDPQKVGTVSARYADRWLVHVNDLCSGDGVYITPSRFAYLWLDHTARRFTFDPARDLLLLDELPRLMKMWDDLKQSGITDTALNNLRALLESKGAAWGRDCDEFRHLVKTALKEANLYGRKDPNGNPLPNVVTPEDVLSGRFARCLELYLYILKQKIR